MTLELTKGILLPQGQRMRGGKTLAGMIWLEMDGLGRVELQPDQAFALAVGIFKNLGVGMDFNMPG